MHSTYSFCQIKITTTTIADRFTNIQLANKSIYEINDIMFFVKSYKRPLPHFDIRNFITFSTQSTRSASFLKLVHLRSQISDAHHFYFACLVRLRNSLPAIDITLPDHIIKSKITDHLWVNFKANSDSSLPCLFYLLCPCNGCSKLPRNPSFKLTI